MSDIFCAPKVSLTSFCFLFVSDEDDVEKTEEDEEDEEGEEEVMRG